METMQETSGQTVQETDATTETNNTENQASGEMSQEDKVAYSSYKKVLSEKKKTQEKMAEMEAKLREYQESEMQAKGKHEDLINSLREQLKEKESALEKTQSTYAWNIISSQIKSAASQKGCVNPDKLLKLLDDEDLRSIECSEDYQVNSDDLGRVLEKAMKDNEFLFRKEAPSVRDVNPSRPNLETDVSKLSRLDLAKMVAANYKK